MRLIGNGEELAMASQIIDHVKYIMLMIRQLTKEMILQLHYCIREMKIIQINIQMSVGLIEVNQKTKDLVLLHQILTLIANYLVELEYMFVFPQQIQTWYIEWTKMTLEKKTSIVSISQGKKHLKECQQIIAKWDIVTDLRLTDLAQIYLNIKTTDRFQLSHVNQVHIIIVCMYTIFDLRHDNVPERNF